MPALGIMADSYTAPASGGSLPVADAVGWWDASDLGLADNASLTGWPDKSGLGRNLYLIENAPIYKTGIYNGKGVVRFDGTAQRMKVAATNPKHCFVVAKYNTAVFVGYDGLLSGNAGGSGAIIFTGSAGSANWFPGDAATYHKNGILFTGTLVGPMESIACLSLACSTSFIISGFFQMAGDRDNLGRGWRGDVAEVIIYDKVLSDSERQQVESYLLAKWLPPMNPTSATCVRWYDASDSSTITHAGGAVSAWRDKGPLNLHLTKGGSTVTTGTRTIGGKNALDFTAGYCSSNGQPALNQPLTIVAVVQSDTATPSNNQIYNGGSATYASGSGWSIYAGGGVATGVPINTSSHVVIFEVNGASSAIYQDGISVATGNAGSNAWSTIQNVGSDGSSSHWDGLIGEVLVYDHILTTPERQQVETYLKNKWGTP